MRAIFFQVTALIFVSSLSADPIKEMDATRTTQEFIIDGKLDEPAWENAEIATGFKLFQPNPGAPKQKTEVKLLYDDNAVYVGAFMHEYSRDSIMMELVERDDIGNTDWFGVILDTYGAGTEAVELIVMSTGVDGT